MARIRVILAEWSVALSYLLRLLVQIDRTLDDVF